ncbi:MAG: class I SAM-dependent methyltransferase [Gemmatimonadetes bacterium]|nr:MAG: class I SAM-dependent methyltransferase [Gemmatimonadota bacterium]
MNHSWQQLDHAFSRHAQTYDQVEAENEILRWMRHQVQHHLLSILPANASILELNAGTGTDAVFLAQHGFHVLATDVSSGMVEQIQQKISQFDLHQRISTQQCPFTDLSPITGQFDCVFSNLGGLNCIPDVGVVAAQLPRVLKPGGFVVWVIMPPVCPWELLMVLKGKVRFATRRWKKGGVMADISGIPTRTYYFTPTGIKRALGSTFTVQRVIGLGSISPTPDQVGFARRHPKIYRFLQRLDERWGGIFPFNRWADHVMIIARYTNQ